MDELELRAADIVVAFVGGRAVARDVGGAQRVHDFDIELADGRRFALEVTRIADEEVMQFDAASARPRAAPQLSSDWHVWIPAPEPGVPAIRITGILGPIANALAVVERHGCTHVDLRDYDYRPPGYSTGQVAVDEALESLAEVGVTLARSTGGQEQPPTSVLSLFSHGSTVADAIQLNALVRECAEAKRDQLTRADAETADERHLLLWVSRTHPAVSLAFTSGRPPDTAPPIPSEIDVVWVADGFPERVWRLRPPGGWQDLALDLGAETQR